LALTGGGNISDVLSLLPACEYRNGAVGPNGGGFPNFLGAAYGDYVGTASGAAYALSIVKIMQTTPAGNIYYNVGLDTKRQKYADLNAAGLSQWPDCVHNNPSCSPYNATGANAAPWWDVEEYNVIMTEPAYWMNYSRPWGTVTNSWLVYLRNACAATETANLYLGATTNRANLVGTFYTTNSLRWNWRYTPLLDASGKPAVLKLGTTGGGNQTLRLEIDPTQIQVPYLTDGLALNYLAFVPYVPGSLQVNLTPAGAVTAGAQWQLDGGAPQSAGTISGVAPGLHTVSFTTVSGYTTPASQYVNVYANQTVTVTGNYVSTGPELWYTSQIKGNGTLWTQETGATVDSVAKTVTTAQNGAARYYQLRGAVQYRVTKIVRSGGNIVLTYQ
jgi:hypothetical protein